MNSSTVDLRKESHQSYSEPVGFSLQRRMKFTWFFTAVQAITQPPLDKSSKHHQVGLGEAARKAKAIHRDSLTLFKPADQGCLTERDFRNLEQEASQANMKNR